MTTISSQIRRIQEKFRAAKSAVFFTGSGISAESGVPTFRGGDGFWSKFRPEELASLDAFRRDPNRVHDWYSYRRKLIMEAQPNQAHEIIAALSIKNTHKIAVITQNVDRLHQRAGSGGVVELHGTLMESYCVQCGNGHSHNALSEDSFGINCANKNCTGLMRPAVVWFGESLSLESLTTATKLSVESDIFFSIGTSGLVYPAADLPLMAKRYGAYTVEVNPESTPMSGYMDEAALGTSNEVLTRVFDNFL